MPLRFIHHHLQITLPFYTYASSSGLNYSYSTTNINNNDSVNFKFNREFHSGGGGGLKAPASLRVGPGNGKNLSKSKKRPYPVSSSNSSLRLQQQQERQRQERQRQDPSNPVDSGSIESTSLSEHSRLHLPQSSNPNPNSKSKSTSSPSPSLESILITPPFSNHYYNNTSSSTTTSTAISISLTQSSPTQMASSTTITSPTLNSFPELQTLLANNQQWSEDVVHSEPGFFKDGAVGQKPKVLWIGCADSRVPESVLTACRPGEIFVHRNIANQFHLQDDSALSVLAYAVETLGVKHVVIVGHTKCGGVAGAYKAALDQKSNTSNNNNNNNSSTPLSRWLTPLINLASPFTSTTTSASQPPTSSHEAETDKTLQTLVELNVKRQVENVCATDVIMRAWGEERGVYVHGWVYELERGLLRDLGVSRGAGVRGA